MNKINLSPKDIFFQAIQMDSPEDLRIYLESACGNDEHLRSQVEELLVAHQNAGRFLGEYTSSIETKGDSGSAELEGQQIGPYKLLEVIGEGGMGTVYMAEQTEPVNRRVALKLIKTGMDTRQVVARFEAERQTLAVMDHPNIAKVLDAGSTESGRPYFVMELVKGKPITNFCDEQQLDTESRLRLFQQVCQGVQHAHQKGIIHRDIKPSNVLVAMYDDRPVPKVIDFGVAKATDEKLTEKTMFTRFGQIVGTLEYMSPEQAQFNQLDIDTRSDIYSLGAVLYELLAGEPPFDREKIKEQALDETLRMIREDEPTKPSTKFSSAPQMAKIASNRQTSIDKLGSSIRGDLDWIVMKALEKDRSRRYETANGLANDIARHLNNEAVMARPPNRIYRLRKFARRNTVGVAIAFASVVLLFVGFAGLAISNSLIRIEQNKTLVALDDAQRQRDRAIDAEKLAEARTADLKIVSEFQAGLLDQIDPFIAGEQLTENVIDNLRTALTKDGISDEQRAEQVGNFKNIWKNVIATDVTIELIDQMILKPAVAEIDKQFVDQPLVGAELHTVLSKIYYSLGMYGVALPLAEQSLSTRRQILGKNHPDTLDSLAAYANCLGSIGRRGEAEPIMRELVKKSRQTLGEQHEDTLIRIGNLGMFLKDAHGATEEAENYLREALEGQRHELGDTHDVTLGTITSLGYLLSERNRLSQSEIFLREAVEGCRSRFGEDDRRTLDATASMGRLLQRQGKLGESEQIMRENLLARRRVLGDNHPEIQASMTNLATVLQERGKYEEAERYFRNAVEMSRRMLGEDHPATLNNLNNLGAWFIRQQRWEEAATCLREVVKIKQRVLGPDHPDTITSSANLGYVLLEQNNLVEAELYLREAVERGRQNLSKSHPRLLSATHLLGKLLNSQGHFAESAKVLLAIKDPASQVFAGEMENRYGLILADLGYRTNRAARLSCRRSEPA